MNEYLVKSAEKEIERHEWAVRNDDAAKVINERNLRVRHYIGENNKGGMTVVYSKAADYNNSSIIELSTSICHVDDCYNKKIGKTLAVERFVNGQTVCIPKLKHNDNSSVTLDYCFYRYGRGW